MLGFFKVNTSKTVFSENIDVIREINHRTLSVSTSFGTIIFASLSVLALVLETAGNMRWGYISLTILFLALIVLGGKKWAVRFSTHMLYAVIMAVLFLMIVIADPTNAGSVAFLGALAILPSLVLDNIFRLAVLTLIPAVVFALRIFEIMDADVATHNMINTVIFYIVGNFFAWYNISNRIAGIISNAKLEWNEFRYRATLMGSKDILFEFDPKKETFHIMRNPGEMIEKDMTYEDLRSIGAIYEKDRERYYSLLDSIKSVDHDIHDELRLVHKNGDAEWYSVNVIIVSNSHGKRKSIFGKLINIDAQKRREEYLQLRSMTDSATGLYNKEATEALIDREMESRPLDKVALLLADIDDLKNINDTYGHIYGDLVIRAFASTLKGHFRVSDIVGRVGGDEFMIFLRGVRDEITLLETVAALSRKLAYIQVGENDGVHVGSSIGIAIRSDPSVSFEQLYRQADIAMYSIKKDNKNGYAFYCPQLEA